MKILAISGSNRTASTNTAMLKSVASLAAPRYRITVFSELASLPIFSPDAETKPLPQAVVAFCRLINDHDGLIIASPEYVRAIPGGLKNGIDWLVSRDEIIAKPIALMHASHRGDDMLAQLRLVLSTVSEQFSLDDFLRFELMSLSPQEISNRLHSPENRDEIIEFLDTFTSHWKPTGINDQK